MEQKKAIAALLIEKPENIDWSLFDRLLIAPIKQHFEDFGSLPTFDFMKERLGLTQPDERWVVYRKELMEDKYVSEASKFLTEFNNTYDDDQKNAILKLGKQLATLDEPLADLGAVSIVRDRSRFARFKQTRETRIKTGIEPFDKAAGGIARKGEYLLIGARTNVGKSWLAHLIAKNMAAGGLRVGLYSGEMSADQVGARFDSAVSHISNYALLRGRLDPPEDHFSKLDNIEGDLFVLTQSNTKGDARPSQIRNFIRQCQLDIVILDQLDNMQPDDPERLTEHGERALLSRQLKTLTEVMGISVIAVSQFNREGARETPTITNIAQSDRFGRDCTLALALEREGDELKMRVIKARDFRIPDAPWSFTWDIDSGVLSYVESGTDAALGQLQAAISRTQAAQAEASQPAELV